VSAAVLAVVGIHSDTASEVLFAVASVLVIYWLVHVYVEVVADRLITPARRRGQGPRRALRHEGSILLSGIPTLLVVAASSLLGASVSRATNIALRVTVVLLALAGNIAGHRAGRAGWRLAADRAIAALFGVLTILLKTLLHQGSGQPPAANGDGFRKAGHHATTPIR
jgi:hypothetical protein